jgi:hypothetical protein
MIRKKRMLFVKKTVSSRDADIELTRVYLQRVFNNESPLLAFN